MPDPGAGALIHGKLIDEAAIETLYHKTKGNVKQRFQLTITSEKKASAGESPRLREHDLG
jgi:hypothetical protein